jgi:hypothetical protein
MSMILILQVVKLQTLFQCPQVQPDRLIIAFRNELPLVSSVCSLTICSLKIPRPAGTPLRQAQCRLFERGNSRITILTP